MIMNSVYIQIKDGDATLKFMRFRFLVAESFFSVAQDLKKTKKKTDYLLLPKQNDVLSCTCLVLLQKNYM